MQTESKPRVKFHPSNGSDAMFLDEYCHGCKHDIHMDCPLLAQSLTAKTEQDIPDEWTAADCSGGDFRCSKRETLCAFGP